MIFDLRIYTLHPGRLPAWLKMYEQYGHPQESRILKSTAFSPL